MTPRTCPGCGAAASGRFCSRCGEALSTTVSCPACGTEAAPGARFCSACGAPVAARARKSWRSRLPWILSGLALVAFAVAISLMIGESVGVRAPGMPPTGGVITGDEGAPTVPAQGLDPSGIDLSSMSGREAADRLFDRAMRTEAAGDSTRAAFFAGMGRQAYGALPPAELDLDARFHVALLALMQDDIAVASAEADAILGEAPSHLLGWLLRVRLAEEGGDEAARAEATSRFLEALPAERSADRPEYRQHGTLIDSEAARLGGGA